MRMNRMKIKKMTNKIKKKRVRKRLHVFRRKTSIECLQAIPRRRNKKPQKKATILLLII